MALLIVDGNSLACRSYFVGSFFEFFNMVSAVFKENNCTHLVFCFDNGEDNWRKKRYPEYKANRNSDPERSKYINLLKQTLSKHFLVYEHSEADDLIFTLAQKSPIKSIVITGDRDLWIVQNYKTELVWFGRHFGDRTKVNNLPVSAHYYRDYKALVGDSSDNVPGIKGIGPKTAKKLIEGYGSLDNIYEYSDNKKLKGTRKQAELFGEILDIYTINVDFNLDDHGFNGDFSAVVKDLRNAL